MKDARAACSSVNGYLVEALNNDNESELETVAEVIIRMWIVTGLQGFSGYVDYLGQRTQAGDYLHNQALVVMMKISAILVMLVMTGRKKRRKMADILQVPVFLCMMKRMLCWG